MTMSCVLALYNYSADDSDFFKKIFRSQKRNGNGSRNQSDMQKRMLRKKLNLRGF